MLAELPEQQARGAAAKIYAEIRATTGVPYVSSLQRHLATRPGWLEWCWTLVGPAFHAGTLQALTLEAAERTPVPSLASDAALARAGADLDAGSVAAIRAVLASFVRVSPTNLGFSALVRGRLTGDIKAGPARKPLHVHALPEPLAEPGRMLDIDALPADLRALVMRAATEVGGQPFVPGLYRMLARWPAWLAAALNALEGNAADASAACVALARNVDAVIPEIVAALDTRADMPRCTQAEIEALVAAIDCYRVTSPQMVVYCTMLDASLPPG